MTAAKRRRHTVAPQSVPPPPELGQHHAVEPIPAIGGIGTAHRVTDQTPLDRYLARGYVSQRQWAAGERLASLAHYAGIQPRVTARVDDTPGGRECAASIRTDARSEFSHALSVAGKAVSGVLIHVCCLQGDATEWAKGRCVHAKTGMDILRLALDALADFWGMQRDG